MPGLMTLSATGAADRLLLLGHVDHAHSAFADLLQQLVRPDDRLGPRLAGNLINGRRYCIPSIWTALVGISGACSRASTRIETRHCCQMVEIGRHAFRAACQRRQED